MTMGERIKTTRRKRGWSQRELARRARVRQATISELEAGMQTETRTDILRRLAQALGVTMDYLAGMYEEDEPGDDAPAGVVMVGAEAHAGGEWCAASCCTRRSIPHVATLTRAPDNRACHVWHRSAPILLAELCV